MGILKYYIVQFECIKYLFVNHTLIKIKLKKKSKYVAELKFVITEYHNH